MADITMCCNKLCPLADSCYRARATPNEHYQSMFFFNYKLTKKGATCDYYSYFTLNVLNSPKT